jgi:hypothetical protein
MGPRLGALAALAIFGACGLVGCAQEEAVAEIQPLEPRAVADGESRPAAAGPDLKLNPNYPGN